MKRCRTCPENVATPRATYCPICQDERRRTSIRLASGRCHRRKRLEDHLNRAEPYGVVRRRTLNRLMRSNQRWREAHPDLADLLAREKALRLDRTDRAVVA